MSDNLHTDYQDGVTTWSAIEMNAPFKELDAVLSALFRGGFVSVIDIAATPAVGPSDLATYLVGAGATGVWATHDDEIAVYDDSQTAWKFITPVEGLTAYVQDENREYQYSGSAWVKKAPYVVAGFYPGVLADSALCVRHVCVFAVDFPVDLAGSYSKAAAAADAETVFSVNKNGSEFGTITFAASGSTGTFAAASATSFAAGDVLTIVAQASADATIADVDFQLKGLR